MYRSRGWPRDHTAGSEMERGGGGYGILLFLGRGFDFKGGSFERVETSPPPRVRAYMHMHTCIHVCIYVFSFG